MLVVLGVALVIPEYRLEAETTVGAIWGLLSGFSFALLQLLNKGYRQRYAAMTIAFYQDLFAFISFVVCGSPWLTLPLVCLGSRFAADSGGTLHGGGPYAIY